MFKIVPFEFPKSKDNNYTIELDAAGLLRTRREQLGLTIQQISNMAKVQFSEYQRLESKQRSLSGCSMRTGLVICAALILDPCEIIKLSVNQPNEKSLSQQPIFNNDLKEKKGGY